MTTGPLRVAAGPLCVTAVRWPGEVRPGDDLAGLVLTTCDPADGDVLVLTSKVVSKSEGRARAMDRQALVHEETRRLVARRGTLKVAETRHGLVLAAAGVDASNAEPGTALALPLDPDGSARRLRQQLLDRTGRNVAVVVSDTAGRAWRTGQTDIAIGCAGLAPLASLQGVRDVHGNELRVTAPAIADEVAAAADLVKGKTTGCPLAVVRGLAALVLPARDHGPGAVALVRPAEDDLFALGTRDAVLAAVRRDDPSALVHFPALAVDDADPFSALRQRPGARAVVTRSAPATGEHAQEWTVDVVVAADAGRTDWVAAGRLVEQVRLLAAAHRLVSRPSGLPDSPDGGPTVLDRTRWSVS